MKTLIVGTGIIGTIYGWALTEAGIDVTHYVRKGKSSAYKNGVKLDLIDERKGHRKNNLVTYNLRCVEQISTSNNYELIIVPTNSYQTEEAIKSLLPQSGKQVF